MAELSQWGFLSNLHTMSVAMATIPQHRDIVSHICLLQTKQEEAMKNETLRIFE